MKKFGTGSEIAEWPAKLPDAHANPTKQKNRPAGVFYGRSVFVYAGLYLRYSG